MGKPNIKFLVWEIRPRFMSVICYLLVFMFMYQVSSSGKNPSQEIIPMDNYVDLTHYSMIEIESPSQPDEIELKQNEMRDPIVRIQTRYSRGSGTIIECLETDTEGVFKYLVLSNAHLTGTRFITCLKKVDSVTGKVITETIDTGCKIITFDHLNKDWNQYSAKIVDENFPLDLTLLSFLSTKKLAVAKIANDEMLSQVRVFDEVFAVGCQLGRTPNPTTGIISQILTGINGEDEWIIYVNTAQITPGSSGGGLFKEYYGHYYLIGIPYSLAIASNGQLIPHLAHAISIATAKSFIDKNSVSSNE